MVAEQPTAAVFGGAATPAGRGRRERARREVPAPTRPAEILLFHIHGRGKGSGAVFEARPGWVQTIRDGKVVRIEAYLDRGEALAAVGLSERLA